MLVQLRMKKPKARQKNRNGSLVKGGNGREQRWIMGGRGGKVACQVCKRKESGEKGVVHLSGGLASILKWEGRKWMN